MQLEAKNICKTFGDKSVLKDFSYLFADGTVTAIMGPSGCGKSTLISILMGILTPDLGEVVVSGNFKRSAVFQENRLCDNLTAAANIRLVIGNRLSPDELKKELSAVGLEECYNKPVRELSGGMKRRVALLRALLAEYDVLFLDEPFKGLDEVTKAAVIEYTKSKIVGRTVIMVTHDKNESDLLAEKVVELKQL